MAKRLSPLILVAIVLARATGYAPSAYSQVPSKAPKAVQRVSVEDIGKTVILIGRLGVPLGQKMELSGYWQKPKSLEKDFSIRFIVTTVNRKQLAAPIEFSREQVQFTDSDHRNVVPEFKSEPALDGQRWTLTAYETGRVHFVPDESGSKSPVFLSVQMPQYTRPFTSELVGVLLRIEVPK